MASLIFEEGTYTDCTIQSDNPTSTNTSASGKIQKVLAGLRVWFLGLNDLKNTHDSYHSLMLTKVRLAKTHTTYWLGIQDLCLQTLLTHAWLKHFQSIRLLVKRRGTTTTQRVHGQQLAGETTLKQTLHTLEA